MHLHIALALLSAILLAPRVTLASDSYTVTLVSVWTNKTASGLDSETLRIEIDGDVLPNNRRGKNLNAGNDAESGWRIERTKTQRTNATCLDSKPAGTSFVIDLFANQDGETTRIGTTNATIQREDGDAKLAFEMKHGKRTLRLRRRGRIDGNTFWLTRVFPDDRSSNYVLRFQITKKNPPSRTRPSQTS